MDQGIMTLVTVGIVLVAAVFAVWLLYTVIWRAVRRGMQEFQYTQWDTDEVLESSVTAREGAHHRRHLPVRLPHRVPADEVPDYPPDEWFSAA